ncbi:hypothetical protein PENARI_c006G00686 [Penicillium arizonense]|uniref:Uncharacterized protein n=1 Tax=Penicillium arizonense TaxID=1835702 RepID=A0A1F5LLM8_PENAI|nr:hypothetical protein PENARI_c006G00686 [Penicillium arizonense]OGE54118.1 hypothetical protein PENARI_c006G00686 [Penicillium arizonense]
MAEGNENEASGSLQWIKEQQHRHVDSTSRYSIVTATNRYHPRTPDVTQINTIKLTSPESFDTKFTVRGQSSKHARLLHFYPGARIPPYASSLQR